MTRTWCVLLLISGCASREPAATTSAPRESVSGAETGPAPTPAPVAVTPPCAADGDCAEGAVCEAETCVAACEGGVPEAIAMAFDTSVPPPDASATLDQVALCVRALRSARIELVGCVANDVVCDEHGRDCRHYSEEYAMAFGDRMAGGVRDALVERGADRDRITTRSVGIERWVCNDETPECRDRNRRVEVSLR